MELSASCKMDLESIQALRRSRLTKKRITLYCILISILLIESIVLFFFDDFPYVGPAFLVLWGIWICYLYIWSPKLSYQKLGDRKDFLIQYTFRESAFHISCHTATLSEEADSAYSGLHHALEGQRYIYLYPSPRSAYIVDKTTMELGHAAILTGWLKTSLGKNYKYTTRK